MAWLRGGDTSYTDPRVLELQDHDDWAMGLAAWGFLDHLAKLCAKDGTYDVAPAYLRLVGGPIQAELLKRVVRAGLMTTTGRGRAKRYRIVDDAPEVLHIRTKAEIEWERRQRSDTGDPRLRAAVLLRDGDACRYCGRVCQPSDNSTRRGRTLDHLDPGGSARSADDLVVACRGCNGGRGRDWQDEEARAQLAELWPLRPVPAERIYVASTAAWLDSQGYALPAGSLVIRKASEDPRLRTQPADQSHPVTQRAATTVTSTTPSTDQPPPTQGGVAASNGPARSAHPDTQRAATPPAPPISPPHPGTQPGVAPPADEPPHHTPGRATRPTALQATGKPPPTDRSGTAVPGRVGQGSGTGRVAGPPSRPETSPPLPGSASSTTPPRSRRGRRRRSRPGGDQR